VRLLTDPREMKEYLRAVPRGGLGYGLLRRLAGTLDGPEPQIMFNYLSQQGQSSAVRAAAGGPAAGGSAASGAAAGGGGGGPAARCRSRAGTLGRQYSLLGDRTRLIEITAWVAGDRLVTTWTYGEAVHHRATIAALADGFIRELEDLIEYCCQAGTGGYTP